MKTLSPGTPTVPTSRLSQDCNTLQERYYRTLTEDCEVKTTSDYWYITSIIKKTFAKVCRLKKNPHLCIDFHLKQANRLATSAAGIFYAHSYTYSSVPCGALMRPLPVSGGSQRGAELSLFSPHRYFNYCFI